jgi:predicted permease
MSHWFGWLRPIVSRCRAVVRGRQLDREFDEELTTHLELLIDEGRRRGLTPTDARREALLRLGQPAALREAHREQRGMPMLDVLAQDLRYAVRTVWRTPVFTVVVTLTLALGIGANTALFSLVDDLLLRSLPLRDPDRLVLVQQTFTGLGVRKARSSFPKSAFDHLRAHNEVVSDIVGSNALDRPTVTVDGIAEPSRQVEQVSESFFQNLGVTPIVGRAPVASDGPVAVLSHGLWRVRFGATSDVLGRTVTVDGKPYVVVGVAPPRFHGLAIETATDLWIASDTAIPQQMIARLKPGVTNRQAQAALEVLFRQLAEAAPQAAVGGRLELLPAGKGLSQLRGQYRRPLLALTVLAGLVLLITCTNVANLLMVRNTARRRELKIRVALGAPRSRLILQYFVEGALVATLGGLCALAVARWGVSIILSMLPLPSVPEGLSFHADARILGFAAGATLVSALLFGLAPAWRATAVDLEGSLKSRQGGGPAKSTRRLGRALVACQVGLSILLLVGAGLFVQTLRNLVRHDVGFNPESLLQVTLDTRGSGYGRGQIGPLYRLLSERVSAVPGVQSVTGVRNGVMQGDFSRSRMNLPGRTLDRDEAWDSANVAPGFFETMDIPVVRGRTFAAADFTLARPVVVISEAFAARYFPNVDPVGARVGDGSVEIIGVVGDARLATVRREIQPTVYFMLSADADRISALQVRTAGDANAVARAVREEVRRVNPRLLIDIKTMRRQIDASIATERIVAATSAFFSLLGLLLAAIGIFGVASYTVAQKTPELGIRMALGAGRWSVIREALRDTMLVFAAGLAAGIVAAIAAVRLTASFVSDLLFGLTAADAANVVGAIFVMVVVTLAACILPARRATRIDPLTAIRHE